MVKVLLVNLEGERGGAETSLLLIAKHLRGRFEMSIACPVNSSLSRAFSLIGIHSHKLSRPPKVAYSSVRSAPYWLKTSFRIIRIALITKPDIIHANSFYAGVASVFAAILTRKKIVLHARDLKNLGLAARLCGYVSKRIIAVSRTVKSVLIERGTNPEKIKVVYNGVDHVSTDQAHENGDPGSVRGEGENHTFTFAQVGQLVPWKNHIVFLKAAAHVAHNLPRARFVLVGDDIFGRDTAYKSRLLSHAENSLTTERFRFLGWQEDMGAVWSRINCLVHTADREPFGRVIIEAMAHKVPVIAVGAGGPSEIVQDGKTGVLVPVDDIRALTNAMLKMSCDDEFAERLATAGHKHVIADFTADRTAAHIQDVYMEVLALGK
ncbi:MAG: glycosyltransferase family 4 protein [Planctomycetota bacterium]|jgi:glycosyltransferase involved in cell wall biosynthesis